MSYLIYSDVSLDIDHEVAEQYDLRFVPMEYMVGEESFTCTRLQTDEEMHYFYERLRKKEETKTSQITPIHYIECFEPLIKEGRSLMYFCLSGGLSNTYSSANMAVKELKEKYASVNIEIIDTRAATIGMGLLVELAVKNREQGMSLEENAADIREHLFDVQHWFKVEDLMYLMRGGRVSSAAAIVGTALNIKPILTINREGKLETIDKKRGNKQAMKGLMDRFAESFDPSMGNTAYICSGDCPDMAEELKVRLLKEYPELNVKITMLSPIIGAHTGPDMIGLVHFGRGR